MEEPYSGTGWNEVDDFYERRKLTVEHTSALKTDGEEFIKVLMMRG